MSPLPAGLGAAVEAAAGVRVRRAVAVGGGMVCAAWRLDTVGHGTLFLKHHPRGPADLFAAEAHGLGWLAQADALPLPAVRAVSAAGSAAPFLLLEYVPPGPARPRTWETFGRGLARLHRAGAAAGQVGLVRDNFIGTLPQANPPAPAGTWPAWWAAHRLRPQARWAGPLLPTPVQRQLDRVCTGVDTLVGPPEPPARLHGDLWSGNLHIAADGQPWLLDPAACAGHREVDLAMMDLFGGFPEARWLPAYTEVWPLAPGWRDRLPVYQLYYLLVHVNLFGASYVDGVSRALGRLDRRLR